MCNSFYIGFNKIKSDISVFFLSLFLGFHAKMDQFPVTSSTFSFCFRSFLSWTRDHYIIVFKELSNLLLQSPPLKIPHKYFHDYKKKI